MENFGIPSDVQWNKMQKFIKSDKYKKEDFFVFETLAVGDRIVPNRYTRIMPDLLEVMKDDANLGVSLMLNHNWSQLGVQSIPIGKVFSGEIRQGTQDGEENALFVQQYILRDDSKVDGYSKNDIINLIETGIISDTSVGWGTDAGSYICSICHKSYYGGECRHWKGSEYIVNEETGETRTCIVEAHAPKEIHEGNNVLMENSVVFDGAYPNAVIQSAVGDVIDTPKGKMNVIGEKEDIEDKSLITAYSFKNDISLMCLKNTQKGGKADMQLEENKLSREDTEEVKEEVKTEEVVTQETENIEVQNNEQDNLEETNNEGSNEEIENVETESNDVEEETNNISLSVSKEDIIDIFGKEVTGKEIISLLKEGKEYRNNIIDEALTNGVKMSGNSFDKEAFKLTFENMEAKQIKELSNAWEKQANEIFSSERISKDTEKQHRENNVVLADDNLKTLKY